MRHPLNRYPTSNCSSLNLYHIFQLICLPRRRKRHKVETLRHRIQNHSPQAQSLCIMTAKTSLGTFQTSPEILVWQASKLPHRLTATPFKVSSAKGPVIDHIHQINQIILADAHSVFPSAKKNRGTRKQKKSRTARKLHVKRTLSHHVWPTGP
jgi:hypothetical protein